MICAMKSPNIIFNTITINKPIVDKTNHTRFYYFSRKINISSVRSIDDSMHTRTLEQTQQTQHYTRIHMAIRRVGVCSEPLDVILLMFLTAHHRSSRACVCCISLMCMLREKESEIISEKCVTRILPIPSSYSSYVCVIQ